MSIQPWQILTGTYFGSLPGNLFYASFRIFAFSAQYCLSAIGVSNCWLLIFVHKFCPPVRKYVFEKRLNFFWIYGLECSDKKCRWVLFSANGKCKKVLNTIISQCHFSDFLKRILWLMKQVKIDRIFQPIITSVKELVIIHPPVSEKL